MPTSSVPIPCRLYLIPFLGLAVSPNPITVVFTDLVGSTAIKGQLPGEDLSARNQAFFDAILQPHRQRVEAAVADCGGRVVKTQGDSYLIVFDDPAQAARWAAAVQLSHAAEPIPTPAGPLMVKVGMHTGTPLTDGNDLVGQEVDCAARLVALANGGQVLLSETTAALIRAARLEGLALHAHGDRSLRGIGVVPVFELVYPGRAPGALKEPALWPNNLPPPPEGLVGREALLAALDERLRAGGVIALKGEGGIGKTTLALAAAHAVRDAGELTGGAVWLNCELAPGLDECLRQTAHVLLGDRMEKEPRERVSERLMVHVRERPALVVLDNFETVARDAALRRWLADLRPPAAALLTTRDVPPGLRAAVIDVHELAPEDAVRLFIDRARAAGSPAPADPAAVRALCAAVGHLPLAIELLAARRLPLGRLLERVERDLAVLDARGDPTRPDRHQSVRACLALSYEHLSAASRDLLLRLSVLPDGAGPDLVAAVGRSATWDEAAEELVTTSVWRLAGARYAAHPLVRQFALEQVGERRGDLERGAARATASLAAAHGRQGEPGKAAHEEVVQALDWIQAEWRNLVACADFAVAAEDWSTVGDLADAVRFFVLVRGRWGDAERLFRYALEARRRTGDRAGEGMALNSLGNIYLSQGRHDEAAAVYREGLAIRRDLGDRRGQATTLNNLGIVHSARERLEEAEAAYRESLAISRDLGDRPGEGATLNGLANILYWRRDWEGAERACRECLAIWREVGDRFGEGKTLNNLGSVCEAQERWEAAEAAYRQSLTIRRDLGDRSGQAATLIKLAALCARQARTAEALDLGRQAVAILDETEDAAAREEARRLVAEWEGRAGRDGPSAAEEN